MKIAGDHLLDDLTHFFVCVSRDKSLEGHLGIISKLSVIRRVFRELRNSFSNSVTGRTE